MRLGLTRRDYEGTMSTLCAGCGHELDHGRASSSRCFEMDLPAHRIAKVSGIGCSSKAPTYFLSRSHGFNSVHGRMPSITTGANMANRDLVYIGVSGDGDTASIGLGQFCHAVRRRLNMTYIVMNNGCYGLTKGQFSATNDKTSPSKKGEANPFDAIDLCQMAIQLGAGFVARSFSGDKTQLIPLIKAAISYNGFAFLDVISPCVTFNNHPTSTKSYDYVRAHNMASENKLDYVEPKEEITADYAEGTLGRRGDARRLAAGAAQARSAARSARRRCRHHGHPHQRQPRARSRPACSTSTRRSRTCTTSWPPMQRPLNAIPVAELCPGSKALEAINARLR